MTRTANIVFSRSPDTLNRKSTYLHASGGLLSYSSGVPDGAA